MEDIVFRIANTAALIGWLLLGILPGWKGTKAVVHSGALPFLLSLSYVAALAAGFGNSEGSFATLDGVQQLFADRTVLLAGWIHYLAFDMLVGSRILIDSQKRSISHLVMLPVLFFTFMFGPAGYAIYVIVRRFKSVPHSEFQPGNNPKGARQ